MLNTKMIGNRITEARKNRNLSQAQLAERLFITPQAVGKWERGESMPDITTLNRLAEILGVDLNYFSENFDSGVLGHQKKEANDVFIAETQSENQQKRTWNMSEFNLVESDFSGLNNLHEKFNAANMQKCLFIGSKMSQLELHSNNVDSCDFSNSDISNSSIHHSNFGNNVFKNCKLNNTAFLKSNIFACDFTEADLTNTSFKSSNFTKNTLENATWNNTSFIDMNIQDIVFEGTFNACFFENCSFSRVKFKNAILKNTFFKNNKKFKHIQFIDCKADKISYAFIKSNLANLSGVSILSE